MNRIQHLTNHLSESKDNLNAVSCDASGEKVVIVGAGLIGVNFAVLFARAGYNVTMYDNNDVQLSKAMKELRNNKLPLMEKYDMLFGKSAENVFKNITVETNLYTALTKAIFVQECIPEHLVYKQDLLAKIGDTLQLLFGGNKCIISSSTTSIKPSILIKKMTHNSSNVLVSHPVNPPMAIPLIEICPHPLTMKKVIKKTREIMVNIGLKPCVMKKEASGFVLNRLQYALLQAAYQIVDEGIADPEDVDNTMKYGLGTRWSFMGPFETIHTNAPKGVKDYAERYVNSAMKPILAEQGITTNFNQETWDKIHEAMSKKIPINELQNRCKWRDFRLLELAAHKKKMEQSKQ